MTTILFIVICIGYIGLGIPDSLFGTVWPAIYPEFDVPVSFAGIVTSLIYLGTILSSLLSARLVRRFGTAMVAFVSTALTAAALLGFSHSENLLWMGLFAIPLGLGAGSIDSGLNSYVALHYKVHHMSFLHCFYGIGVSLSPYLMSIALRHGSWQQGYETVFFLQLSITAVMFFSLPLWKKMQEKEPDAENVRILSIPQMLALPSAKTTLTVFLGSCAIEAVTLSYGSTFLTQRQGISPAAAAEIITFYYIGLALGRFLSGVLSGKLSSQRIILIGEAVTLIAVALTLLPLNTAVTSVGLFLVGLGNGPVFPNMCHLTPIHFGKDAAHSLMGLQTALGYCSFLLAPVLFGIIAQFWGAAQMPWVLLLILSITMTATAALLTYHAKKHKE